MVIHDMRNPATSIDYAIKEVLKVLKLDRKKSMQKQFRKMTNSLQQIQSFEKVDKALQSQFNNDKMFLTNQENTQKMQNIPRAINTNFTSNIMQYKYQAQQIKLEEVKEGENESFLHSQSKNIASRQSDQLITENSSMSGTQHNIPFVMNTKESNILQEQSKAFRVFHQKHEQQYLFESNSRQKNSSRINKMQQNLIIDPSKCDLNEQTPSIFRRSLKQPSHEEIISNNCLQKKGVLQRNQFSFQQDVQSKKEDKAQDGFDQDLFNVDLELKNKLQTQGVIMREDVINELELLLKNSLFSSTMLLNLINDLLDLAKIENSSFNFQATYFNLFEIINHALDALDFQAQQKDIKLVHQYDEDQTGFFMQIYGDKNRYLQILLNFLSNAIKFTPRNGTIIVETIIKETQDMQSPIKLDPSIQGNKVKNGTMPEPLKSHRSRSLPGGLIANNQTADESAQQAQKYIDFEIRIIDSGYGISPENLDKLFMNFSKLEEHNGVNERGTGLGLSICKSLCELMGGSVQVNSIVGEGATFIVKLKTKCKYVPKEEAIKIARSIEQRCRSRYSKNNQIINQNINSNAQLSYASNIQSDLKQSKNQFDGEIEEESKKQKAINQVRSQQENAHFNSNKQIIGTSSPQPRKSDQMVIRYKGKCLVANDNQFQLIMISRILRECNFEVEEAENGLVATQKALQTDYSFIILDLDMPIMNGYEACQRIKQRHSSEIINLFMIHPQRSDVLLSPRKEKNPLVFALSALINQDVIKECTNVGFDDFFESPFDVQKFKDRILPRISSQIQEHSIGYQPFFKIQSATYCQMKIEGGCF